MELTTKKMHDFLALNDEQKALLSELKTLGEKMKRSKLIILFDSFEISFAAINGEHIEEVIEDGVDDTTDAVEMSSWCDNWGNVDIPCDFEFRSSYGNPFLLFTKDVRNRETEMQKMIDGALAYC